MSRHGSGQDRGFNDSYTLGRTGTYSVVAAYLFIW